MAARSSGKVVIKSPRPWSRPPSPLSAALSQGRTGIVLYICTTVPGLLGIVMCHLSAGEPHTGTPVVRVGRRTSMV